MSHKARARNARPYGHDSVMRSSFFPQHCRGAHRAPVIGICAKFRICSFTVTCKFLQLLTAQVYTPENALYPPSTGSTMPVTKLAARSSTRKSIAPISSLSSP